MKALKELQALYHLFKNGEMSKEEFITLTQEILIENNLIKEVATCLVGQ